MNLFQKTLAHENNGCPPIWFMRQAGRYHSHYQKLKEKHSFIELCRKPNLAAEVTMGPIEDFDFDAAILFSDLLFPLDVLGMGLSYEPSPKLQWYLTSESMTAKLIKGNIPKKLEELSFQSKAIELLKHRLPSSKGLIGFVGGPFTLFSYAVVGSHQGDFSLVKQAMHDDRFTVFNDEIIELVAQNMKLQTNAGLDAIAIFDTASGELTVSEYTQYAIPALNKLISRFKELDSKTPIIYYSKNTNFSYWSEATKMPINVLGVDWKTPLPEVLSKYGNQFCIQGNFDPDHLLLPTKEFETKTTEYFEMMKKVPKELRRNWISGLGHGVLQKTPEAHVRTFIKEFRRNFS